MQMGMEQWWNDTDVGKLTHVEKNLSHGHFVPHTHILHGLAQDETQVSLVRGQCLTA